MMSDDEKEAFLPTRQSLLSRLKNWEDNDSWRDFFDTYWRLIYGVARQAGFNDAAAQDIVQDTVVAVAKNIGEFRYDPGKGRFKNWLRLITRRRIADQLRKDYREPGGAPRSAAEVAAGAAPEVDWLAIPDPATADLDGIWEREWNKRLMQLAMERVKRRVRADHYQIFDLCTAQGWPVTKVAKALGVGVSLIYVTRHRIGTLLKKELRSLEKETG